MGGGRGWHPRSDRGGFLKRSAVDGVSRVTNRFSVLDGKSGGGIGKDMFECNAVKVPPPVSSAPSESLTEKSADKDRKTSQEVFSLLRQCMEKVASLALSDHPLLYLRTTPDLLPTKTKVKVRLTGLDNSSLSGAAIALVDSGATSSFMDPRYAEKCGFTLRPLPQAIPVYYID